VQMDFSYLKADGSEAVEDPAEVVLTVVDCQTGLCHSMSLPAKNFEKNYVVKTIKEFVAQLGHRSLAIRTDGEPMIVQLAEAVRDELTQPPRKPQGIHLNPWEALEQLKQCLKEMYFA